MNCVCAANRSINRRVNLLELWIYIRIYAGNRMVFLILNGPITFVGSISKFQRHHG